MADFVRERHVKFFGRCLQVIPTRYASFDTTRMTIAFFGLSGLDVLSALDTLKNQRQSTIDWIYSLQVHPNENGDNCRKCGFRGSSTLISKHLDQKVDSCSYDGSHIAMTYTALLSLLILGDNLQRVHRTAILQSVRSLQCPDGSFAAMAEGSENDMRFVYCACCICYVLDDWSGMDVEQTCNYIRQSLSYDGAFAQGPGLEAHGGSTFCAVASLWLMGRLESVLSRRQVERLKTWCLFRQSLGFQGRPNKPIDTCYSFWVGATLQLLDCYALSNASANRDFLMTTQDRTVGGFAKWPDNGPDALHAYFGTCGLSLMGEAGLEPISAALNITQRAADNMARVHAHWRGTISGVPSLINWCSPVHVAAHVAYLRRTLSSLGSNMQQADVIRLSLAHFLVVSLDLLQALPSLDDDQRQAVVDWVYGHQVSAANRPGYTSGFCGGAQVKGSHDAPAHIVMTYSALCTLLSLGDDLSRVSVKDVVQSVQTQSTGVQQENSVVTKDMKMLCCALAIEQLLTGSCGTHVANSDVTDYVKQCLTHEGAFSQVPGSEAHGGATYCAVVSLSLLGRLDLEVEGSSRKRLLQWCVRRLCAEGVSSRCGKAATDCSYIFWLVATMTLLKSDHLLNKPLLRRCLLRLQNAQTGGFSSARGRVPDVMHTYFALAALSLLGESDLAASHTLFTLSQRAGASHSVVKLSEAVDSCLTL